MEALLAIFKQKKSQKLDMLEDCLPSMCNPEFNAYTTKSWVLYHVILSPALDHAMNSRQPGLLEILSPNKSKPQYFNPMQFVNGVVFEL